ncbi:hypothetical protein D3C87_1879100 [compost metagenome]
MRQQWCIADEFRHFIHDLSHGRRTAHHGRGDAGQAGNETRDRQAGVHQALVAFDNAPLFKHDHGDFRGPAMGTRRDPGGFEVDDGDTFQTARTSMKT